MTHISFHKKTITEGYRELMDIINKGGTIEKFTMRLADSSPTYNVDIITSNDKGW